MSLYLPVRNLSESECKGFVIFIVVGGGVGVASAREYLLHEWQKVEPSSFTHNASDAPHLSHG
uniref:Uncharacterized protein n=1 Tax=uncultured marine virus TaxID=186617 RepID=A0A0F7L8Z5_9VIRU|nr:hypothetical protein [uncultured marine virus]